eukprot:m.139729 g.139729  ORF g.139729 m.139729 type:complete len:153 (-) comp14020_c0_seq11:1739-2197(-)
MMCIESFNLLCDNPNAPCDWDECVYNTKNGGFLDSPADFFTSDRAAAYFKMRLQYIVARYGGSPAVFAWEFFNEVDITNGFSPSGQTNWVGKMAPYLASIDPYGHPISTSFCCHDVPEVSVQYHTIIVTDQRSCVNACDVHRCIPCRPLTLR